MSSRSDSAAGAAQCGVGLGAGPRELGVGLGLRLADRRSARSVASATDCSACAGRSQRLLRLGAGGRQRAAPPPPGRLLRTARLLGGRLCSRALGGRRPGRLGACCRRQRLLGLRAGRRQRLLGLLAGRGQGLLGLLARRADRALDLGPGGRDDLLGLGARLRDRLVGGALRQQQRAQRRLLVLVAGSGAAAGAGAAVGAAGAAGAARAPQVVVLAQQPRDLALDLVEEGVHLVEGVAAEGHLELLVRDVGRRQRHGVTLRVVRGGHGPRQARSRSTCAGSSR